MKTGAAKPRGLTARKLARALNVSLDYLLNDDIIDLKAVSKKTLIWKWCAGLTVHMVRRKPEALLQKNMALFAGGALSQEAKDAFFEAVMTAYVTCKGRSEENIWQEE